MKFLPALLLSAIMVTACADMNSNKKSGWFFGTDIPPLEWPKRHWKGQDYKPSINPERAVMSATDNRGRSMFNDIEGLKPDEFIQNLKNANIIHSVNHARSGLFKQTVTDDIIITLDHNFYTLAYADQKVITELLAKSIERENYLLKDKNTKKIVGQIKPEGVTMF